MVPWMWWNSPRRATPAKPCHSQTGDGKPSTHSKRKKAQRKASRRR